MNHDPLTVMASTFRAWWQSLADQDPDEIAAGNSLDARRLWTTLVAIGKRNGAVIAEPEGDPSASSWAELDPDFDWNGEIIVGADAPIAAESSAQPVSLTMSRWHNRVSERSRSGIDSARPARTCNGKNKDAGKRRSQGGPDRSRHADSNPPGLIRRAMRTAENQRQAPRLSPEEIENSRTLKISSLSSRSRQGGSLSIISDQDPRSASQLHRSRRAGMSSS